MPNSAFNALSPQQESIDSGMIRRESSDPTYEQRVIAILLDAVYALPKVPARASMDKLSIRLQRLARATRVYADDLAHRPRTAAEPTIELQRAERVASMAEMVADLVRQLAIGGDTRLLDAWLEVHLPALRSERRS